MSRNDSIVDYQKAGDSTPLPRPLMTRVVDYLSAEDTARAIYAKAHPMETSHNRLKPDQESQTEDPASESTSDPEGSSERLSEGAETQE